MDDNILLNDLMTEIKSNQKLLLSNNDLQTLQNSISKILINYSVQKFTSELMTVRNGLPNEVKSYIASRGIEGLSQSTLKTYTLVLTNFFKDTTVPIVNKNLDQITANMIRTYLFNYSQKTTNQGNKVSNATIDRIRIILSAFFGWANTEGYISSNPALNIKKIKYQKARKEALTDTELEILRSICKTTREKAIIEFFFSTGARVSEACNTKITDLDLQKGSVTILGKGNKYRTDYLSPKAIITIKNYLETRDDDYQWLFISNGHKPKKLTKSGMEYIVNDLWKRSGITKKITPHILRHTTATIALKRGMPIEQVQKLLGHENINTTMIYAEVNDSNVKNTHAMVII